MHVILLLAICNAVHELVQEAYCISTQSNAKKQGTSIAGDGTCSRNLCCMNMSAYAKFLFQKEWILKVEGRRCNLKSSERVFTFLCLFYRYCGILYSLRLQEVLILCTPTTASFVHYLILFGQQMLYLVRPHSRWQVLQHLCCYVSCPCNMA